MREFIKRRIAGVKADFDRDLAWSGDERERYAALRAGSAASTELLLLCLKAGELDLADQVREASARMREKYLAPFRKPATSARLQIST